MGSLVTAPAVAEVFGLKLPPWFSRVVASGAPWYLMKLPGLDRKIRVSGDWTRQSPAVRRSIVPAQDGPGPCSFPGREHFRAGQNISRKRHVTGLASIETGEVEVSKPVVPGQGEGCALRPPRSC